jgi:hypothetical protein
MSTDQGDFFEEDEPVEDLIRAWHKGEKLKTRAPLRPGVTVLVAAHPARFNGGMLTRALTSVIAQTHVPQVITVVNDSERRGAGWTRRTLLGNVETEWIAWIDSDDEWTDPEHLAKLLRVAVETDAVFVFSWFHGGDPLGHFGLPFNPCTPHHTTMGHLVRTDIAQEVGFPDSEAGPFSNEDWAFITGVAKLACERGLKMVHLAERTWTYHQHGQNTSGQPFQGDAI